MCQLTGATLEASLACSTGGPNGIKTAGTRLQTSPVCGPLLLPPPLRLIRHPPSTSRIDDTYPWEPLRLIIPGCYSSSATPFAFRSFRVQVPLPSPTSTLLREGCPYSRPFATADDTPLPSQPIPRPSKCYVSFARDYCRAYARNFPYPLRTY